MQSWMGMVALHSLAILLGLDLRSLHSLEIQEGEGYSRLEITDNIVLYSWASMLTSMALWSLRASVCYHQRCLHSTKLVSPHREFTCSVTHWAGFPCQYFSFSSLHSSFQFTKYLDIEHCDRKHWKSYRIGKTKTECLIQFTQTVRNLIHTPLRPQQPRLTSRSEAKM